MLIHATSVAIDGKAVLIRGAPGSGKSTLALALLESAGNGLGRLPLHSLLVSDDQCLLELRNGTLFARAPESLRGKLEVRGLGIVEVRRVVDAAAVVLVVDLDPAAERFPTGDRSVDFMGVTVPRVSLPPHAGALAARVRVAFSRLNSPVAGRAGEA